MVTFAATDATFSRRQLRIGVLSGRKFSSSRQDETETAACVVSVSSSYDGFGIE
jgi:hypothetical protein